MNPVRVNLDYLSNNLTIIKTKMHYTKHMATTTHSAFIAELTLTG